MSKDDLIEPYTVHEIFVDGFIEHRSIDGVMSCVGYRKSPEGRVIVVRLAWPETSTQAAIDDANAALATKAHWERSGTDKIH